MLMVYMISYQMISLSEPSSRKHGKGSCDSPLSAKTSFDTCDNSIIHDITPSPATPLTTAVPSTTP